MSQDAQSKLVEWLREVANSGGEILERELPVFAQEIVAWHFLSSMISCILWASFSLLLFIVSVSFLRAWSRRPPLLGSGGEDDITLGHGFLSAISFFAAVLLLIQATNCLYEAVKARVAPRVTIIEYTRKLIR